MGRRVFSAATHAGYAMRIYYDRARDVIVVEGSRQVFPPKGLAVDHDDTFISVWQAGGATRVVKARYDAFRREDGSGFSDLPETVSYLNTEFSLSTLGNYDPGDLAAIFESA